MGTMDRTEQTGNAKKKVNIHYIMGHCGPEKMYNPPTEKIENTTLPYRSLRHPPPWMAEIYSVGGGMDLSWNNQILYFLL